MDRSEIMEIRRLFKTYHEEGCPANGFSGGFIDSEGYVHGYFAVNHFHDLGSSVKKRIFTLASKTISNNAVTIPVNDYAAGLFEKINAAKGTNPELAAELSNRISRAMREAGKENTYSVHILSYTYDPPAKTKDHRTILDGVSDEIYNFFVCMVSPVTVPKASYGYFPEKEVFDMNPSLHVVGDPVMGFVYPDFSGRTSDSGSVLYFRTGKLDLSAGLFGEAAPPLPAKEKQVKEPAGTGSEVENKEPVPEEIPSPGPYPELSVPSLDTGSVSLEEVRGRDISDERKSIEEKQEQERIRKEDAAGPTIPLKHGKKVRITGNTAALKRQMIDGVMCLIVPVSDADIL